MTDRWLYYPFNLQLLLALALFSIGVAHSEPALAGMGSVHWDDCDDCGGGSKIGAWIIFGLLLAWGLIVNPIATITIVIGTILVMSGLIFAFRLMIGKQEAIALGVFLGFPAGIWVSAWVYNRVSNK